MVIIYCLFVWSWEVISNNMLMCNIYIYMVVSIICLIMKGMMCDGRKFLDFDRDIAGCFIKHYHIYICMLFLYISMIIFPHITSPEYILYIYISWGCAMEYVMGFCYPVFYATIIHVEFTRHMR